MSPSPCRAERQPFYTSGITRGTDWIARYDDLQPSVVAMVRASVERHPDVEALVEVGGERTDVRRALGPRRPGRRRPGRRRCPPRRPRGLAPPRRVSTGWSASWGTLLSGAVAVPVNTRFAPPRSSTCSPTARPPRCCGPARRCRPATREALDDLAPGDLAAIFYTSGTTGRPKGARTTHGNFLANVETAIRVIGIDRADGPSRAQPGVGSAVPRDRVQLPVARPARCRWHDGGAADVQAAPAFVSTIVDERIDTLVSVPAIYGLTLARDDVGADLSHAPAGSPTAAHRSPRRWYAACRSACPRPGSATASD